MRIAYRNLWDDYTIAATTENANYPASNTQDKRLSYYTRTTADAAQYWTVDLGSAQDINCVAIAGHNITDGCTLKIQASTNNFSTTAYDYEFTSCYNDGVIICFLSATQNYRYWRFYIDDASNPDTYLQIGRFFLGTYLQVTPSSNLPFNVNRYDTSQVAFSVSGQAYYDKGVSGRILEYSFSQTGNTMKQSIDSFYDWVGIGLPFFFVNTENYYTLFEPLYCVLTDPIQYQYEGNGLFTYNMSLREVY